MLRLICFYKLVWNSRLACISASFPCRSFFCIAVIGNQPYCSLYSAATLEMPPEEACHLTPTSWWCFISCSRDSLQSSPSCRRYPPQITDSYICVFNIKYCLALILNKTFFQIFDGKTVPERMVDGWNAFFFDDIDKLVRLLNWELMDFSVISISCFGFVMLDFSTCAASAPLGPAAKHGVGGGVMARAPSILHWRVWLQGARHQHSPAETPHHVWKTVDE